MILIIIIIRIIVYHKSKIFKFGFLGYNLSKLILNFEWKKFILYRFPLDMTTFFITQDIQCCIKK